ncbi:MAG: hypothetical protein V1913_09215 [Fibrobacterota bacterium]
MIVKDEVLQLIRSLPKSTTIDDIMEELYFKSQVDEGLAQLDSGKKISHKTVTKRIQKWIVK